LIRVVAWVIVIYSYDLVQKVVSDECNKLLLEKTYSEVLYCNRNDFDFIEISEQEFNILADIIPEGKFRSQHVFHTEEEFRNECIKQALLNPSWKNDKVFRHTSIYE